MTKWQIFGGPHDGRTIDCTTNATAEHNLRQAGITGTVILHTRGSDDRLIYLIRDTSNSNSSKEQDA